MISEKNIIILTGGAFCGKSLVASALASQFRFSGVVSTDMIRNILSVEHPKDKSLDASTYRLSENLLQIQKSKISNVVKGIISIYSNYGEKVIFEGMHFSDSFLEWCATQNFYKICIHNLLPLRERVVLKSTTRTMLSFYNTTKTRQILEKIDKKNVDQTVYMNFQERIEKIQTHILECCRENNFEIIEFVDINQGIEDVTRSVDKWIKNKE